MPRASTCILVALFLLPGAAAQAEPTRILVRALADDAKFIGTGVGTMHVVLSDADTGEVLAEGRTEGGTGDTARLMSTPRERHMELVTGEAAGFAATLELDRPRRIRASVEGPRGWPGSAVAVSQVRWVLPGRHLEDGDGWVLEVPGLIAQLDEPDGEARAGEPVRVTATVQMMCGCPLTPGGLWDSDGFEVMLHARPEEGEPVVTRLDYAGEASRFGGSFTPPRAGTWELELRAWQAATGNAGVATRRIEVRP